jgi:predicted nucleotidyltransferase
LYRGFFAYVGELVQSGGSANPARAGELIRWAALRILRGLPYAYGSESSGQVITMIERLLSEVVQWASAQPDIVAVALVGSYARGAASPTSDVDLVILTSCPQRYLQVTDWAATFGPIAKQTIENWGKVTSLRVWYESGKEVEFGITIPEWVAPPIDEGTWKVISDGIKILFDRHEYLATAIGEQS